MAGKRSIEIEVLGDVKKATAALSSLDKSVSGMGSSLKTFGKAFAGAFAADQIVSGLGSMVSAARESQKVTKETEAILKATGNAAGLTADQIGKLSTALSNKTAVDDEVIQKNQNVLLTFTKIRNEVGEGNDVFNRASAAMLDLGQVFGSVDAAAMQLGKALNDPVAGMTALARSGVSFTAEQKNTVKAMVEANDVLGAQKLILSEVERQVGGTAAATATNSDRMKVAFGNLQETIGAKLLPVVERFSGWMVQSGIPAMERFVDWTERKVVPVLQDWARWTNDHVVPALQTAGRWIRDDLVPAMQRLAEWVDKHVVPALKDLGSWLADNWPKLVAAAKIIIDDLKTRFEGIKQALSGIVDFVKGVFSGEWGKAWNGLKDVVAGALKAIIGDSPGIMLDALRTVGRGFVSVGEKIGEYIANGFIAIFEKAVNAAIAAADAAAGPLINFGNVNLPRVGGSGGGSSGPSVMERAPVGVLAPGATYNPATGATTTAAKGGNAIGGLGSTLQSSIVAGAKAMLGKTETDPSLVKTLGRDLQGEANAWCQLYVNRVFKTAGIDLPNNGSESTRTSFEALKKAGMASAAPVVGGLAYKTRGGPNDWKGHVGIVTAYDPKTGMVTTIEGNAGDKVAQKTSSVKSWNLGFVNPFGKTASKSSKAAVPTVSGTLSPQETASATRTTASSSRSTAKATQDTAAQTERVRSGIDVLKDLGMSASDATREWHRLLEAQGGDQAKALALLKASIDSGNEAEEEYRSDPGSSEGIFARAVAEFASAVADFVSGRAIGGGGGIVTPIGGGGGGIPDIPGMNPDEGEVRTEADGSVWMFTGGRWVMIQPPPPPIYADQSVGSGIVINVAGSVLSERDLTSAVVDGLRRSGFVRPDGQVLVAR